MTITFPISLPATPNFVTFDLQLSHATGRSASPFTSVTNVQEFLGSFWSLRATLPRMLAADADEWFGAFASLRGGVGTFLLSDPDHLSPRGTGNGTPLVNGGSQTGILLVTNGWANGETVLKRGDLFQLGSGSSAFIYMVTQDVTSDGSGNATIDFVPRLRASPGNGSAVVITSPQGRWRMATNDVRRTSDLAKFRVALAAVEAF